MYCGRGAVAGHFVIATFSRRGKYLSLGRFPRGFRRWHGAIGGAIGDAIGDVSHGLGEFFVVTECTLKELFIVVVFQSRSASGRRAGGWRKGLERCAGAFGWSVRGPRCLRIPETWTTSPDGRLWCHVTLCGGMRRSELGFGAGIVQNRGRFSKLGVIVPKEKFALRGLGLLARVDFCLSACCCYSY